MDLRRRITEEEVAEMARDGDWIVEQDGAYLALVPLHDFLEAGCRTRTEDGIQCVETPATPRQIEQFWAEIGGDTGEGPWTLSSRWQTDPDKAWARSDGPTFEVFGEALKAFRSAEFDQGGAYYESVYLMDARRYVLDGEEFVPPEDLD